MKKKLILLALALVCASAFVYKAYAKNVDTPSREIGLSVEVGADVVSVVGSRFVLYKQSSKEKNRKIEI